MIINFKTRAADFLYDLFKNRVRQQPLKLFYTGFFPKSVRASAQRYFVDYCEQNRVADKWGFYIKSDLDFDIGNIIIKKSNIDSNVIWQYWGQGLDDIPDVVKASYASVDKYAAGKEIIRLTDESVDDYIEFPEIIKEKLIAKKFRIAHYSDILRLALLYHYGGLWLDSTVVLTEELSDKYWEHDIFMFSRDPQSPYQKLWEKNHPYFDWRPQSYVRHLTSFIVGKAGDKDLELLLKLIFVYWKYEEQEGHYFFWNILCQMLARRKMAFLTMPTADDAAPHLLARIIDNALDQKEMESVFRVIGVHKLSHGNILVDNSDRGKTNFHLLMEKLK
jgi:hypothetical protein